MLRLPSELRAGHVLSCGMLLMLAAAMASEARAVHHEPGLIYGDGFGPGYYSPRYVGRSSFDNPVGTGFGGYSYGGYPNYGYWGYLPGVYAGYGGVAPAPGYATCPYTVPVVPAAGPACAPACPVAVPAPPALACEPTCLSRRAYRRYMRRMCRAMAQCGCPAMPLPATCCYGALLGADAMTTFDTNEQLGAAPTMSDFGGAEEIGPRVITVAEPIGLPDVDDEPELQMERSL